MRCIFVGVSEVTRAYGISSIECSRRSLGELGEQMLTALSERAGGVDAHSAQQVSLNTCYDLRNGVPEATRAHGILSMKVLTVLTVLTGASKVSKMSREDFLLYRYLPTTPLWCRVQLR